MIQRPAVLHYCVLLGESYSRYIWAALAPILAGVFLAQPQRNRGDRRDRGARALVPDAKDRQDKA
jgi:hypothetical protein